MFSSFLFSRVTIALRPHLMERSLACGGLWVGVGVGLDVSQVSVWDEELGLPWRHSWFPGILIHSVILIKGLGFPEKNRKYFIWCVFVSPQKLLKLLQLLLTSSWLIKPSDRHTVILREQIYVLLLLCKPMVCDLLCLFGISQATKVHWT